VGDKLLIRAYNVGVGDCTYVRIPDGEAHFHILIDCGTIGKLELLKNAIGNLQEMLPDAEETGQKRLDLLVATHRHRDHIKGFDPRLFEDIQIKNIWLSAAMNPDHTQAEGSRKLHAFATTAVHAITSSSLSLSPQLQAFTSLYSLCNDAAMDALREDLLDRGSRLEYVHAGRSSRELDLPLKNTVIRVLAPEKDIDGYYLGQEADLTLRRFQESSALLSRLARPDAQEMPTNISEYDFRRLQSRLLANALAFAETDSSIQNNTSVVLLIEWRKRRLLFVGDAEWEGEYRDGKHNGSWNVMWEMDKQRGFLDKPVDFLKIGHHGSINATPWNEKRKHDSECEVNSILDAILPLPGEGERPSAQAIVSTMRSSTYKPIPSSALLVEVGKRVSNTQKYYGEKTIRDYLTTSDKPFKEYWEFETKGLLNRPQPWRTDLERIRTGKDYVDVWIEPGKGAT
jgi:beta-lactamase superfamily II metal-dependent hydrolase